jgi:hypothetical protein
MLGAGGVGKRKVSRHISLDSEVVESKGADSSKILERKGRGREYTGV